jgi:hypothetical protein
MRRLVLLVTVVLLMTALLVASAAPVLARGVLCPCTYDSGPCSCRPGTALPTVVCDVCADGTIIGWQNGQCWVFYPAPTSPL